MPAKSGSRIQSMNRWRASASGQQRGPAPVFIAVADRCRTERGVQWLGGSVIVRRSGYPAAGPVCEDRSAVLTATIDLSRARDKRISERNDLFADRRPDLYARLLDVE